MKKLTITGNIKVKPECLETVKEELLKRIPITQAEEGCIQYNLHQDNEDPTYFMFYKNWESHELWQTHMNNEHLKATDGMVEKFWLHELIHIG